MRIFEFKNEEDYRAAQRILIDMHQKNPPPPVQPSFAHFVADEEASLFWEKLVEAQLEHTQESL